MIRIYGLFKRNTEERDVPVKVSLKPFDDENCMFLDLEGDNKYLTVEQNYIPIDWKPVNGLATVGWYFYNKKAKEYIDSRIVGERFDDNNNMYVFLEDGRIFNLSEHEDCCMKARYQKYENCKPIGEPFFLFT